LAGFGNAVKYQLNDAYVGLEYKFRIGNGPTNLVCMHWYDLISQQSSGIVGYYHALQPQWNSDYDFNKSES
jgi:hypothetical protein